MANFFLIYKIFPTFLYFLISIVDLISSITILMMVHSNRNAIVSTLLLNKSLLLGLPCYQFFFYILSNYTLLFTSIYILKALVV